jgi:proline-specific peptidase
VLTVWCIFTSIFLSSCAGKVITEIRKSGANPEYVYRDYVGDEKYISVNGINVCYIDNNIASRPTLLFLHGLSLSIHNFRYNYPDFFDKYRVVAVDFPGFGKSEMPNAPYSIDFFVAFTRSFMDKLGIDKAVLIGNSLGSHVALEFALNYPQRVQALVIESSTGIRWQVGILEYIILRAYITENQFKNISEKKMREHIEWSWYHQCPASEELVNHRIHFRRKYYDTLIYEYNNKAFVRGLWHVINDTIRYKVNAIAVPTLIVWGRHDSVTKLCDAHYLHRKIKGSRLEIIENAGHLAHIEQPEAFNKVVRQYLEDILRY